MTTYPLIFDRPQVRRMQTRAAAKIPDHNFLIDWNLRHLIERLGDIKRTYPTVLLMGGRHSPEVEEELIQAGQIKTLVVSDPSDAFCPTLCMDEEQLPFKTGIFDLVLSPFSLHHVNDVPGALIQMRQALKPDGLMLAAFPGGESLIELRQSFMKTEIEHRNGARMRVHPFIDKQQAAELIQRGQYALPVVDSERIVVTYDNAFRLMQDLRYMGETNSLHMRDRSLTGKNLMLEMAKIYAADFSEPDGQIRATFEMIFLSGWSPHASQQQPLRPGSAQSRLAAALGTEEIGTGEIAHS